MSGSLGPCSLLAEEGVGFVLYPHICECLHLRKAQCVNGSLREPGELWAPGNRLGGVEGRTSAVKRLNPRTTLFISRWDAGMDEFSGAPSGTGTSAPLYWSVMQTEELHDRLPCSPTI